MERTLPGFISKALPRGLLGIVGLGALVLGLVAGGQLVRTHYGQPRLVGNDLGREAAPDFVLRDSSGHRYALDQFRGKVVVLTFFYTHCPDECPLTAEIERHADDVAANRNDVVYLAVSVDPVGDTPESIRTFTKEHHLDELGDRWHYLVGTLPELQGVWKSYYTYAPVDPSLPAGVGHSTGLFFVDKQGKRRVYTGLPVSPEDVAGNELALAK